MEDERLTDGEGDVEATASEGEPVILFAIIAFAAMTALRPWKLDCTCPQAQMPAKTVRQNRYKCVIE